MKPLTIIIDSCIRFVERMVTSYHGLVYCSSVIVQCNTDVTSTAQTHTSCKCTITEVGKHPCGL